jgi:hypothetical protein
VVAVRVLLRDQVLGGGDEVVEDVLLLLQHPRAVPVLAERGAAPEVGHGVEAALLDEGQHGPPERRRLARGVESVTGESRMTSESCALVYAIHGAAGRQRLIVNRL